MNKQQFDRKLLLHCCCGPCAIYPFQYYVQSGWKVSGYFDNSNIHPYREWKRRLSALRTVAQINAVPLYVNKEYHLEQWLSTSLQILNRCQYCYEVRLLATAEKALEMGITTWSTTLLVSPRQNIELLQALGHKIAEQTNTVFLAEDLRNGYEQGQKEALALEIYRQGYCGCIFSERDRYYKKNIGKIDNG